MIDPGSTADLSYPRRNHVASEPIFIPRRIEVRRVRDLVTDPLDIAEFLRRPYIRRSRWLVTGVDLDTNDWRQFYIGSTAEHRSPGVLRVCLWDCETGKPWEHLARDFEPTPKDCTELMRYLLQVRDVKLEEGLKIAVYSNDLRVVA